MRNSPGARNERAGAVLSTTLRPRARTECCELQHPRRHGRLGPSVRPRGRLPPARCRRRRPAGDVRPSGQAEPGRRAGGRARITARSSCRWPERGGERKASGTARVGSLANALQHAKALRVGGRVDTGRRDDLAGYEEGTWGLAVLCRPRIVTSEALQLGRLKRDFTQRGALVVDPRRRRLATLKRTSGRPLRAPRRQRARAPPSRTAGSPSSGRMPPTSPPARRSSREGFTASCRRTGRQPPSPAT